MTRPTRESSSGLVRPAYGYDTTGSLLCSARPATPAASPSAGDTQLSSLIGILTPFSLAEGVVYDMFDEARHVVDILPAIRHWTCVGLDYGTINPVRALLIGVTDRGVTNCRANGSNGIAPRAVQGPRLKIKLAMGGACTTTTPNLKTARTLGRVPGGRCTSPTRPSNRRAHVHQIDRAPAPVQVAALAQFVQDQTGELGPDLGHEDDRRQDLMVSVIELGRAVPDPFTLARHRAADTRWKPGPGCGLRREQGDPDAAVQVQAERCHQPLAHGLDQPYIATRYRVASASSMGWGCGLPEESSLFHLWRFSATAICRLPSARVMASAPPPQTVPPWPQKVA